MASMLGKRKRRAPEATTIERREESEESDASELDAQEIFRRHFEAQFKPLPAAQISSKPVAKEALDELEEDSDWDGISDDEENGVQVVEHTEAQSSKLPKSTPPVSVLHDKAGISIEDDDASEAANLKKDLALQRLLAESHLLDSAKSPTLSGNNRHKATDLRLQALGSKTSILKQEKMPMSHRKGIIAKQSEKEDKRRREARENGIILEKAQMKKSSEGKRDRGVGAPGVGRFSGGTLTLSKKDISEIEGPRKNFAAKGGRGGGQGGGRERGKRGR
ncbi:hypothetical protein NA56DRAFT_34635 [Hyaloscypha hepaticicola]|uniref:Uncharacterized protein n=1 Tax=Hyaloscypha hepaticicola TaxID=2082293 RepID=A0A2J6QDN4_9HELO|nr:hypothetical protein NA56DRAFT_34635 [Hyaloscypha hepaticicola]